MDIETQTPDDAAQDIRPDEFIAYVTQAENLAAEISDGELARIASVVLQEYEVDKTSMAAWKKAMQRGIDLAELVKKDKDYPFKNASNIKYPLITSAALQFNARAYPAIVPADRAVSAKVYGSDPGGLKAARGERVSSFMSWQLAVEIEEWESETDKLLVQLPIVGKMFRKVWYDPVAGRTRCRLIDAGRFVVNDNVRSLDDAPRCTEELYLYPDEIETRIRSRQFVAFDWTEDGDDTQAEQLFLEQHCRIDLDADGYSEPYIVTIHKDTETIVRMVADFDPDDVSYSMREDVQYVVGPDGMEVAQPVQVPDGILGIRRNHYFVDYDFVPGMSGGFWSTGLGILLGDINDGINSIINMMLDAGHYASLGGGFIGSELRLKGGSQRMRPGEWRMVGAGGQDIRSAVVPMTFPGPDATLFQLLGLMIDAGRELASVKDVMTGDAQSLGANASPTTVMAMIEQGMMVFTAAYKRIFRSLRREFRMIAKINAATVDPQKYNAFHDGPQPVDPRQDFSAADMDIEPVADPRSVTKMQEAAKAQFLMTLAQQGMADPGQVGLRVMEAMSIGEVEELAPKPDPMAQAMAQMQMQAAQADLVQKRADIELTLAKVESEKADVIESMAKAQNDAARTHLEARRLRIESLTQLLERERGRIDENIKRGMGTMAGAPGNGGAAGHAPGNPQRPAQPGSGSLLGGPAGPGF